MRDIDPMKKDKTEKACFAKYLSIVDEIEDKQSGDESVHDNMRQRYTSAKKDNTGHNLWQKYEAELTNL